MPKPITELTDAELLRLAAGVPSVEDLSDEELLGLAAQQGYLGEEEAAGTLRNRKKEQRQAALEQALPAGPDPYNAFATPEDMPAAMAGRALAKPLLTAGGPVADVAVGVLPTVAGSIVGSMAKPGVGTAVGGAAGAAIGEGLVQTRQYLRGERDEPGPGRLLGATVAGAVPVGAQVANLGRNVVRRAGQGALISGGAELTGQVVDEGTVDLERLAASGALGALFGGAAGGVENALLRRAVLQQIRRTPEFAGFKGTDAELVDAVRQRVTPPPRQVDPAAEPAVPAELPALPPAAAPEGGTPVVTAPPSPRQWFEQVSGLPPVPPPAAPEGGTSVVTPPPSPGGAAATAAPAAPENLSPPTTPPAAPPVTALSDEELLRLAAERQIITPEPAGGAGSAPNLGSGAETVPAQAPSIQRVGLDDEAAIEAAAAAQQSPVARLAALVDPAQGHLTRGGDYVQAEILKPASNEQLTEIIAWARGPQGTPFTARFVAGAAAAELRTRGLPVDEIAWQQSQPTDTPLPPARPAAAGEATPPTGAASAGVEAAPGVAGAAELPAGAMLHADKGTLKQAAPSADSPAQPFEDGASYQAAADRYRALREREQAGQLDAAGHAELEAVERTLGQDFFGFAAGERGQPTSLGDEAKLQREEIARRAAARLQAADLQSQVDLFGPATDKTGQFSLFETTANAYLDAKRITKPTARAGAHALLQAVWERRLAQQGELDLATDATLAGDFDPPGTGGWVGGAAGPAGQGGGLGRPDSQLPNAQVGPQPGGLHLEARLYTQAFLAEGFLSHVGRKFESEAELVAAAQVLRNRNVETLWILPYDAEGRLLAPLAFSSRLPNTVALGKGGVEGLAALVKSIGAKSFDLLHNHPSGQPKPSEADMAFTEMVGWNVPNFRRHYIINHGTYSVMDRDLAGRNLVPLPEVISRPDPSAIPSGAVPPFLGAQVRDEIEAVRLGYNLQVAPQNVTLVLLNAHTTVVATGHVAMADLQASEFARHARNLVRGTGATTIVAFAEPQHLVEIQRLRQLREEGVFADVVVMGKGEPQQLVIASHRRRLFEREIGTPSVRVAEDGPDYATAAPTAPAHFVSQFDKTPVPQPLAQMHLVRPVEMPELVQLTKALAGSIPQLKKLPKAHGYMRPQGSGKIVLDRRIFADPIFAQQVLAHELGHLVDYLPDRTLERGNILGRIASLRGYLAQSLPLDPHSTQGPLSAKERQQIRRAAEKHVGPPPPKDEVEDLLAWRAEVRKTYSEFLQNALEARGLAVAYARDVQGGATVEGVGAIGDELRNLSFWWRPMPDETTEHYRNYRNSSVEIYADALSVLFNAPAEFRSRAPTAWQAWFAYLDRKPEAFRELQALWTLLHQGYQAVSVQRTGNIKAGFAKAEEIFLRKWAEQKARRNSLAAIVENFKQKHFNVYAPIIDKARQARASGARLKWSEDPEFVFDAHPLAENANYRFLDRVQKQVLTPLEDAGVDGDTLGRYLFLNRVAREAYQVDGQMAGRGVLANPQGHTAITARKELAVMRHQLRSPTVGDKWDVLQAAARRFQDLAFEVIERGHAAGIYSDEQLALARANRHAYATFAVVDYLEDSPHISAAIRQQRGTLRDVANPWLATVIKMMTANKFAELNRAKRVAVQLLAQHFPEEIAMAPVTKVPLANGRLQYRPKPPPDGKRELVVMDQGRPVTWHVAPDIADMFDYQPPASAHSVVGVMNWAFRNIFYPSFLTYNPAFQLWANPIRDLSRSYVKLPPGVQRRRWLGEQLRARHGAVARLRNDITGEQLARRRTLRALAKRRALTREEAAELQRLDDRALVIEILVQRGITTPFESFAHAPLRGDVWGEMLANYRLGPGTNEHQTALRKLADYLPPIAKLLDWVEFAGMTAEAMPKIGAYRVLTRELGWSAPQAAYFIRNHVGTPNYTKRGRWTAWDGTLFLFVNIFVRGLEADVQQMRGKIPGVPVDPAKLKFSYWRRMAERTLGPRLLQAMAAAGLVGAGLKKYYDAWSDYDKSNCLILPLGTTHDGNGDYGYKSVGLRLPEDETARLIGGVMHHIVQLAATQDDPAAKASLANLVNFAGGQLPGVSPVVTLADGWAQYASGINPQDRLRGSPVLSDAEFKVGGWAGLAGMAAWTWDEVGGGNFIRYDPRAQTWQEHMVGGLPMLSRAVKITDAGLRERQRALEAIADKRNAQIRLAMPWSVNQLLGEYYRLNAIRAEHRTPQQAERLAVLADWHRDVWAPNYQLMQQADADDWRERGKQILEFSQGYMRGN